MHDIENRYLKAIALCAAALVLLTVGAFLATAFFLLISALVTIAIVIGTIGVAIKVAANDKASLTAIKMPSVELLEPEKCQAKAIRKRL